MSELGDGRFLETVGILYDKAGRHADHEKKRNNIEMFYIFEYAGSKR